MPEMRMDASMEACTSFPMRGSRKFFSDGGPTLTTYFFCWWWERWFKYQYKRAIIGPAAKRHLNGVSLAGHWWPNIESLLGSCVILQGIRTSMAKKPYIFVIFQGRSGPPVPPPPPSGSAHVSYNVPPTSILHLDSDQPVRMCSCKRISVFAFSFMKMTFTSANFFNYDQTMAIACTYII